MASVSVYEGIDSILERINCIFGQFQQQIWADIWLYGGKYHFWEYSVGCRAYIAVRFGGFLDSFYQGHMCMICHEDSVLVVFEVFDHFWVRKGHLWSVWTL